MFKPTTSIFLMGMALKNLPNPIEFSEGKIIKDDTEKVVSLVDKCVKQTIIETGKSDAGVLLEQISRAKAENPGDGEEDFLWLFFTIFPKYTDTIPLNFRAPLKDMLDLAGDYGVLGRGPIRGTINSLNTIIRAGTGMNLKDISTTYISNLGLRNRQKEIIQIVKSHYHLITGVENSDIEELERAREIYKIFIDECYGNQINDDDVIQEIGTDAPLSKEAKTIFLEYKTTQECY